MPFELTNALITFPPPIYTTICKYQDIFVIAYLNNILIYSKRTLEKYIQLVKKIFKVKQEAEIKLWPDKYEFYIKGVKFLKSVIMTNRI